MAIQAEAPWGYAAGAMEAEWLTFDEAAEYLRVSRPTMYRLIKSKAIVPYRMRGLRGKRFRKKDLDGMFTPDSPKKSKRT